MLTPIEALSILKNMVDTFNSIKELIPQKDKNKIKEELEAYKLVEDAVLETKRYIYDLEQGRDISREIERKISDKWEIAAEAVDRYSNVLFSISKVKQMGWIEHNWSKISNDIVTTNLDSILWICRRKIDTLK